MKIVLYNSIAEKSILNKTKYLNAILTLEGTLREACSVSTPSIIFDIRDYEYIVKSNNIDVVDSTPDDIIYLIGKRIIKCNFVYIEDFNRYYYVTDRISINKGLWRLNMRSDVLMSFKVNILNLNAFVTRNEFTYNALIRDDLVTYEYDKDVTEYIPLNGDKKNLTFNTNTNILSDNFTITVINDQMTMSFDTITPPSDTLPTVSAWNSGITASCVTYASYPAGISTLYQRLNGINSNLADGVISVVAWPFIVPHTSSSTPDYLRIKTTTLDNIVEDEQITTFGVQIDHLDKKPSKYFVVADFTIDGDSFLDYEPYTQYEIYLPYLGWVGLSADVILNKRLLVIYTLNYQSGSAQVSIIDDTDGKIIYTSATQLGVLIPINSTNQYDVERNKLTNNISLGLGLASSAITTVAGFATMNPVAIAGGVLGAGKTISSYVANTNANYLKASGSVASGQSGVYLPQEVRVRKTSYIPKNYDRDYASLHGRPLNEYVKLSELRGYTVVGNVHLEGFDSATDTELNEIDTLLKEGIII